ncbi:MAG: YfhO family protein, partial [Blastocatellia bacterium]
MLTKVSEIIRRIPPRAVVTVFLVLLPVVYFHPAVTGGSILLMGDSWVYSVLMRMLLGEMISQAILPLWNPYTFAGTPFLAAIQPGALYPPNWLFGFLPAGAAINVVVITAYHVSLSGTYRFARALRFGRMAALVTAVIFSFGGFFISHPEYINYIAAAAWLPWILLAVERLAQRPSWRWVALGASFIALQCFAGLPQATWQILIVAAPYAIVSLFRQPGRGPRGRFLFHASAMAVCGFLLSAIQLFPALELQQQGERAQIDYETFSTFSLPLRRIFTLVFPYFFGGGHPPLYRVPGWDEWWALKMSYAYTGFLGLLLGSIAIFSSGASPGEGSRRVLVRFWMAIAIIALVMSFGSNLPFELNRLFYRIPINNLFRAPYRHSFEFTFAFAVLAGYGVSYLKQAGQRQARVAVTVSLVLVAAFVAATAIAYRFFGPGLGGATPPPGSDSLTNPEAFVPLVCFALSALSLSWFLQRPAATREAMLLAVLLADLALFGQYTQWRLAGVAGATLLERLHDPPAISFIKSRERDLHSFRVLNYSPWAFGPAYAESSQANLAIAHGIHNVNGYDPMRPARLAAVAGGMDIFGVIRRADSFRLHDQGFNLLNVKYLLRDRTGNFDPGSLHIEGIRFSNRTLDLNLGPGAREELESERAAATEIALVTTMTDASLIREAAPVARIRLHTKDGRAIERELLAGRDTSEWAWDRADVKASVKHGRAPLAESWDSGGFEGHRYLSRFAFDRAEIERVEIESLLKAPDTGAGEAGAGLMILRASLHDATTGAATALDRSLLPAERWRRIAGFGWIEVYENLRFLPRAWFVNRLIAQPSAEVLRTLREGKFAGGAPFDPAETALMEMEDFGARAIPLPAVAGRSRSEVKITRYEPLRIELLTRHSHPGFLVLSEIYYRGWEAKIDGRRAPVERVNYALRGLAVPAGDHRIEFFFRAPSFRLGAKYSLIGVV